MRVPVCAGPIMAATLAVAMTGCLAGCGSGDRQPPADADFDINYGSFGTTADINCGNGKSLNVGGSNNTLNVTGMCGSVKVGGSDNTIRLTRVDGDLWIVGLNNTVSYKAGDPNVDDSGSGNRVNAR